MLNVLQVLTRVTNSDNKRKTELKVWPQHTSHRHGLKARGSTYFSGFKCTAGGQTITAQPDGMVYPAPTKVHIFLGPTWIELKEKLFFFKRKRELFLFKFF